MTIDDVLRSDPAILPVEGVERPERPNKRWSGCLVGCFLILPLLYLLSLPFYVIVMFHFERIGWNDATKSMLLFATVFYAPIEWLGEKSELFKAIYEWYFSLFDRWIG